MISTYILMKFSSLELVQIRTWKRSATSFIICNNHPFSAHFLNIDIIIIKSLGFHNSGNFKQISGTIVVELITILPLRDLQYSRSIKSSVRELQVTNCIFNKGKATSVYIQGNSVSNATFKNVAFNHNEASSIEYISHQYNLVISNCSFYNSFTGEFVIRVSRANSVEITHSFFSEN